MAAAHTRYMCLVQRISQLDVLKRANTSENVFHLSRTKKLYTICMYGCAMFNLQNVERRRRAPHVQRQRITQKQIDNLIKLDKIPKPI